MFNSRKQQTKKMMREEKEDNIVQSVSKSPVYKKIEHEEGALVPIIFTSEGIMGNDQAFAEPLKMFDMMNLSTIENAKIALNPLNQNQLNNLDWNNRDIIYLQVENYIRQQSRVMGGSII